MEEKKIVDLPFFTIIRKDRGTSRYTLPYHICIQSALDIYWIRRPEGPHLIIELFNNRQYHNLILHERIIHSNNI